MSQRLFESYKPFFVMQVKQKDRNTCCCRQHIEVRSLIKKCMEFRKHLYALNPVISPDLDHDRHFTNIVQTKNSDYLKSISADIQVMREFTDGCSAQYKSRNCMGDVSTRRFDIGYKVLIRNLYSGHNRFLK